MKFVSNRNIVVASTHGHAVRFEKGVPQFVPKVMHAEVLEKGILPVEDDTGEVLNVEDDEQARVMLGLDERAQKIAEACTKIAETNNGEDFTAAGAPRADVVASVVGFRTNAKEVALVWVKIKPGILQAKMAA